MDGSVGYRGVCNGSNVGGRKERELGDVEEWLGRTDGAFAETLVGKRKLHAHIIDRRGGICC